MANHVKPTKEELDEEVRKSQEELDQLDDTTEDDKSGVDGGEDTDGDKKEKPEDKVEDDKEEDEGEEKPEDDTSGDKKEEEPDYKKKFSESSREAQKIHAKNRRLNKGIDEATEIPEPTEDELKAEYPEYDLASDIEKLTLKETYINKRFRQKLTEAREDARKIEKWGEDVDKFTEDPKNLVDYPGLEGKLDEFKLYAQDEKRNSIPFDVLVPAFLHQHKATAPKPNKGKMMDTGSGGPNKKEQSGGGKLTLQQSEALRNTNFEEYKRQLKANNIETGV